MNETSAQHIQDLEKWPVLLLLSTAHNRYPWSFLVAGLLPALILAIFLRRGEKTSCHGGLAPLPGYSIVHTFSFFRRRHDFLKWAFQTTRRRAFQFSLGKHALVVLSGEEGRHTYFTSKNLDILEATKNITGAIPLFGLSGLTMEELAKQTTLFQKRLVDIQRKEPLSRLIPQLLDDVRMGMEEWGPSGEMNPLTEVYDLTFRLVSRSLSCMEIADDRAKVIRLKALYDTLETTSTAATILFRWAPTPAMIRKLWATKQVYDMLSTAVTQRVGSGVARDDTLQKLLDAGDEPNTAIGFIMGFLTAGGRAVGTMGSWLVAHLAANSDWRQKAADEVESLLPRYSRKEGSIRLSERLADIPIEAWETETPVIDAIIREITRIAQPYTALRRNVGPDMHVDGIIIPSGAFVAYPFSDVHMNPDLYDDPWTFNPGRKESQAPLGYIGWGGGRVGCPGTRLAKLQMKLVTAMLVLGFDISLVDRKGERLTSAPPANWNDTIFGRPEEIFYLKYSRVSNSL